MKNRRTRTAIAFLAIALLLNTCIFNFSGCGASKSKSELLEYTVELKSGGGMLLSDIEVFVYADDTNSDLVWRAITDKEGKTSFKTSHSEGCVLVISDIASGYDVQQNYPIDPGHNEIIIETVIRKNQSLSDSEFKLGDIICDFTVTAANGNEYNVSDLIKEKKAVILNFWFMNCGPCRSEFPYLQQAYEEYNDEIEVLALNPVDGTDESISVYADELALSFPMAVCSPEWEKCMKLTAYPTTVVIDRYGMISFIHTGSITEKDTFVRLFEYYSSDDYVQATIRSIDDIVE